MTTALSRLSVRLIYPVAGAAILILALLGHFVIQEYRRQQLDSVAEAASHYIRVALRPLARELALAPGAGGDAGAAGRQTLLGADVQSEFLLEKIWAPDGRLVFSSQPSATEEGHGEGALGRALAGETAVELHVGPETAGSDGHEPIALPYIEVYVPLLDPATGHITAVGEVYQEANDLLDLRAGFERNVWLAVGLAIAGLLGLIGIVSVLNRRLSSELERVAGMAEQNRMLRDRAEQARLEGARANEALLNRVGSELHDGPVQLLTLMLLKGAMPGDETGMAQRALRELRAVSSGMILPELHGLSLSETVRLAVERHEALTGSTVGLTLDPLPDAAHDELRVGVYRAVQEGLSNAWRHAAGQGQEVQAGTEDGAIVLRVTDSGSRERETESGQDEGSGSLGLLGLRHRISALGGTLRFTRRQGAGGELMISIPVPSPDRAD